MHKGTLPAHGEEITRGDMMEKKLFFCTNPALV